jgi:hypothetical protein
MQTTARRSRPHRRHRADGAEQAGAYALRCTVRALEAGHLARSQGDGTWLVCSDSRSGSHRVGVLRVQSNGVVWLGCDCESAVYRPHLPVPCKHAATVGLRLERDGAVAWSDRDGLWHQQRPLAVTAA